MSTECHILRHIRAMLRPNWRIDWYTFTSIEHFESFKIFSIRFQGHIYGVSHCRSLFDLYWNHVWSFFNFNCTRALKCKRKREISPKLYFYGPWWGHAWPSFAYYLFRALTFSRQYQLGLTKISMSLFIFEICQGNVLTMLK